MKERDRDQEKRGRAEGKAKKWRSAELLCIHSSFNISPHLEAFHLSNHPSIQSFNQQPAMHPFIHLFIDATNSSALPPNHASIFLSILPFPLSARSPSSIHLSICPSTPVSVFISLLVYPYFLGGRTISGRNQKYNCVELFCCSATK